jgi:hypothetical protein
MACDERSPSVLMGTSSTATPVAAVMASATVCDCVVASSLARVPRRSVVVVVVVVRVMTRHPTAARGRR